MIIKADAQGQEAIKQLCDIALKTGGLSNMQGVMQILQSTQLIKDEPVKEDTAK